MGMLGLSLRIKFCFPVHGNVTSINLERGGFSDFIWDDLRCVSMLVFWRLISVQNNIKKRWIIFPSLFFFVRIDPNVNKQSQRKKKKKIAAMTPDRRLWYGQGSALVKLQN